MKFYILVLIFSIACSLPADVAKLEKKLETDKKALEAEIQLNNDGNNEGGVADAKKAVEDDEKKLEEANVQGQQGQEQNVVENGAGNNATAENAGNNAGNNATTEIVGNNAGNNATAENAGNNEAGAEAKNESADDLGDLGAGEAADAGDAEDAGDAGDGADGAGAGGAGLGDFLGILQGLGIF